MSRIDKQICDEVLDKVTEGHNALSDEAKAFLAEALDEDDIIDYLQAILYYQEIIKARFYMEGDADERDYALIEIMKTLINCFLDHVDDI